MKHIRLVVAALGMFFIMAGAHADPILWTLNDVVFDDEGTATGSFIFDATTGTYSDISIVTVGGGARVVGSGGAGTGSVWPGATYAFWGGAGSFPSRALIADEFADLDTLPGTISGFSGILIMMFASDLTDDGGTIALINDVIVSIGGSFSTAFSGESTCNAFPSSTGCFSIAPFREIVGGSVSSTIVDDDDPVVTVPEPGTLALLGIGMFAMGLFSRRRKKV